MKILWVGDAVVSSGFARCTHAVCDHLHAVGHNVTVLGMNYFGDPNDYPYKIWPCLQPQDGGLEQFGHTRLPRFIQRLQPDVVVILNDPWNIRFYLSSIRSWWYPDDPPPVPIVAWLAVDAMNHKGDELNNLAHVVTWTEFARNELVKGGYTGSSSIVPLGVDRSLYYPVDRMEARETILAKVPEAKNGFIVGAVGRNQPRKRLDLTIKYFAEWVKQDRIEDAWLYLHVAPTGDKGCDIRSLVRYYGLKDRVILAEPIIGIGVTEEYMRLVYSSFDVYLSTSQAEGFCLPAMEAMACGVPCVVPNQGGLGEWSKSAALQVNCPTIALCAPLNGDAYTIGNVPDEEETILALDSMYHDRDMRSNYSERGLSLVSRAKFQWSNVGAAFESVLGRVISESLDKQNQPSDFSLGQS